MNNLISCTRDGGRFLTWAEKHAYVPIFKWLLSHIVRNILVRCTQAEDENVGSVAYTTCTRADETDFKTLNIYIYYIVFARRRRRWCFGLSDARIFRRPSKTRAKHDDDTRVSTWNITTKRLRCTFDSRRAEKTIVI